MTDKTIPFSVLDLAPIPEGSSAKEAFTHSLDLARLAEKRGYHRYWLAEHHNMTGIASAATAVLIGQVAAATSRIRVGSGGIMLPNHAPMVIAEQFGTLAELFPGRIDLGLGRAPGTDQRTLHALRVDPREADAFPQDVRELQAFLADPVEGQILRAVPGAGTNVPVWILGSSLFGAQLAAEFGLPYAFASHFAPAELIPALHVYRTRFKPSAQLAAPYAVAGVNVIAAPTDQRAAGIFRGQRGRLPPPIADIETFWSPTERVNASRMLACSFVGAPETVAEGLRGFIAETGVDEVIVAAAIHDHPSRIRSYEILDEVSRTL